VLSNYRPMNDMMVMK